MVIKIQSCHGELRKLINMESLINTRNVKEYIKIDKFNYSLSSNVC